MPTSNNSPNKPVRNSSIELLRILALFFIVLHHFATHGFDATGFSVNKLWWCFLRMGGDLGINIFVLISGYFLVKDNKSFFNLKHILKFWGQVFFYSVVFYCLFLATGRIQFDLDYFVQSIFPITFGSWWFASTYFVLYLLHPFINILLGKLDKPSFQKLLALLLIMWCIIPSILMKTYESNSLLWFVTLYCFAGYIRLYGLNSKFKTKHYLIIFFVFSVLRYLSCIALMLLGNKIPLAYAHSLYYFTAQSVLTFVCAVTIFMVFSNIDIGYRKWINIIASATFGVYLIHDNDLVRSFLWYDVFHNGDYGASNLLIPYSIGVALLVYAGCVLIDLIRKQLIEKPYMMLVNKYSDRIFDIIKNLYIRVRKIIFGD